MKKYGIFALTLVFTTALFTGCGCTNRNRPPVTVPTTMPTIATTAPTTEHTTPSTHNTTEPTIDHGNGPLEDNTTGNTDVTNSTNETVEGRARRANGNVG